MTRDEKIAEALIGMADEMTALARALDTDKKKTERKEPEKAAEPEIPAPVPDITLEQVRGVLAGKSREGHTEEIKSLLNKYGSNRLSGITPENYAALLADAEGL